MKTFGNLKIGDYLYSMVGNDQLSRNPSINDFYQLAYVKKYVIRETKTYIFRKTNESFIEFKCSLGFDKDGDFTYFAIPIKKINEGRYFSLFSDPNSIINMLNVQFNNCIRNYKWRLDREKEISIVMPIQMKVKNMDLYSSTKRKLLNLGRALTDNVTIGTLSPFLEESNELLPF